MNCGDNHPAPIMAQVTILTPNNVGKRQQQQQQQDVLMMSSLSDDFARQLSSSSSPLVLADARMTDDNDDHQHFEVEPTLHSPSASAGAREHLGVIISGGGHQQSDDTAQRHSPADKSCHYSDGEDDEEEAEEEEEEEEEEEHEEEEDALVRASRLSRRHSSAGAVPMSLTVSPSNVFTDAYQGGTSVIVSGRGLVRERSAPTRRCRIEEEQQSQPRSQSATSSARPAAVINNNVGGNWLNVPGAADSSGKKNKTASSSSGSGGRNNVSVERLELVPAASMRNKSPSGAIGSLAAPGRRLQQNHSFGGIASELQRPSNSSLESGNKELLRHHRPSSTSQHHHVRSQSVRVAPRSPSTTTSHRNNNISSSINQQKLFADYNSFQQHQQSIKVRPRGTSLPGTNRADPASATTAINAEEQQQQQHYYGNNQQQTVGGEGDEADYYLLRHFIVHGKSNKVVNRGDSFRRSLRSHKQQQQQSGGAISQHSSTSSISTENVAGSPPPIQQPHQQYQYQQQQGQYYSSAPYQQHYSSMDQVQQHPAVLPSSSSSRRASLSLLMVGADHQQYLTAGPSPPSGPYSLGAATAEPFRVLMLGASGVGKTALTAQFMTSEYLNTYEASLDEDACDRSVSVLLDGEESQLIFIDHPHGEISVENCIATYNPHAYVIVYSVVDAESLREVEDILHFLWRHSLTNNSNSSTSSSSVYCRQRHNTISLPVDDPHPSSLGGNSNNSSRTSPFQMLPPPTVILVANKIDLVRSRIISPQAGKSLATSFDCKYIETSSGMQHNVDELLVGILKQIRLKIQKTEQQMQLLLSSPNSSSTSSSSRSLFRKRSGRRRQQQQQQQQQQHRVNYQGGSAGAGEGEGSCCISTSAAGVATGGYRITSSTNRRSASLRVRRMLGKAVWTCAEYYHRNKSRSCEDLHVL